MTHTYLGYPSLNIIETIRKRSKSLNCLCFTAQEPGSTIKLLNVEGSYKTSTDGQNWNDYELGTLCSLANIGDRVYFSARDKNESCKGSSITQQFVMSGKIAASGNIQYLLDSTGKLLSVSDFCYFNLFISCYSLVQAPDLPAMTISKYCYCNMFNDCSSLVKAPELPATVLADKCYDGMFLNCASLICVPSLPALTLSDYCYEHMFKNCTSLSTAPELPATTLEAGCYSSMFRGCTSLTSAPKLSATTLIDSCYYSMFYGCSSLASAPELPATVLEYACYDHMFYNCTSLIKAPKLPAKTLIDLCYYYMFYNCNSLSITTDPTKSAAYQILSAEDFSIYYLATYNMFSGTAGDFTGTPVGNLAYYCYGNV